MLSQFVLAQDDTWTELNQQAITAYEEGNFEESMQAAQQSLLIAQREVGTDHPYYATSLNNIALLYVQEGNYERAEPMYLQSLDIRKRKLGDTHHVYGASLTNLAALYKRIDNYQGAEKLYLEAMPLIERQYTKKSLEYAEVQYNLADLYLLLKKYEKSRKLLEKSLETRSSLMADTNVDYLKTVKSLAQVHDLEGDYGAAENYLREIAAVYNRTQNPKYIDALEALGEHFVMRGVKFYEQAIPIYTDISGLKRQIVGENHVDYAEVLERLSSLYAQINQPKKAIPLQQKVVRIYQAVSGKKTPVYATALNNLGDLYRVLGRFQTADSIFKQALATRKEVVGEKHPDYAKSLHSIAELYTMQTYYYEAEPYYQEAIEVLKVSEEETKHPYYEEYLVDLADLYLKTWRYKNAIPLYKESVPLLKTALGEKHPTYVTMLLSLADALEEENQNEEAESLFETQLPILEDLFGKDHPHYVESEFRLAHLYSKTGRLQEAKKDFEDVEPRFKLLFGEKNPDYAYLLESMAILYTKLKDYPQAEIYYKKAFDLYHHEMKTYYPYLSLRGKNAFCLQMDEYMENFYLFAIERYKENPAVAGMLYEKQMAYKKLLFLGSDKIVNSIYASNDIQLIDKYDKWFSQKTYLTKLYRLNKEELAQDKVNLKRLQMINQKGTTFLDSKSTTFSNQTHAKLDTWKFDVKLKLRFDEAAVELIRAPKENGEVAYIALIVHKTTENHPEMVVLKNGKELETNLLQTYQSNINNKQLDKSSYGAFWEEIATHLEGKKSIVIAPNGVYSKINISSLWNPKTEKYLFEDFKISYLSSTNYVKVRSSTYYLSFETAQEPVVMGRANYAISATQQAQTAQNYQTKYSPHLGVTENEIQNQLKSELNKLKNKQLDNKQITNTFIQNKITPKSYEGNAALEDVIKSVENPKIVHLGLEGYASQEKEGDLETYLLYQLQSTGLFFAGAKNGFPENKEGMEDGILTAYEMMNLKLTGTEMVVIPSFQSFEGDFANKITQALHTAGVKFVLLPLWKQNDAIVNEFVNLFYSNYFTLGKNKKKAFRQTMADMKQKYESPYFWAGFMLYGEE
jgi:tetratricopeptide (TPR) repeat protein